MNPSDLSVRLRSVADRLDRSERPSRSAVAAELRRIIVAVGPTKVVVSESWTEDEARAAATAFGAVAIGQGPFDGSFGLEIPAQNVDKCVASANGGTESNDSTSGKPGWRGSADSVHVFDSWDEVSGGDPEYAFEMLQL